MKYKDAGFRYFDQHFVAMILKEDTKFILKDFPGEETANAVLFYGYVDHQNGMTLEVIAAGQHDESGFHFAKSNDEAVAKVRMGNLVDEEFYYFEDADQKLAKRYESKLAGLALYKVNDEIAETRTLTYLDGSRDEYAIDDVMVYLLKNGLKTEGCWVRIDGSTKQFFVGHLLNEPDQNFGYHLGDQIAFVVTKDQDGNYICASDMNTGKRWKRSELEDGHLLVDAISVFDQNKTRENFMAVLEVLRDSWLYVPYVEDQLQFLQDEEDLFVPVFTSEEVMNGYQEQVTAIRQTLLEIIAEGRKNDSVNGIVVNGFTEPFILDTKLWDFMEELPSRIKEEA